LKKKLKALGTSLMKYTETRWLSRYRSVESTTKLTSEQRELIKSVLWDYKYNGNYIYRNAINSVYGNLEVLNSYVKLVEPINSAVKILQVSGKKYKKKFK
jgi:hypothetical protein